jgi:hypothetical protein
MTENKGQAGRAGRTAWERIDDRDAIKNVQGMVFGAAFGIFIADVGKTVFHDFHGNWWEAIISAGTFGSLLYIGTIIGFFCHNIGRIKIKTHYAFAFASILVGAVSIYVTYKGDALSVLTEYASIFVAWLLVSRFIDKNEPGNQEPKRTEGKSDAE